VLSLVYRRRHDTFVCGVFERLLNGWPLVIAAVAAGVLGLALLLPVFIAYAQFGEMHLYWTRAAAAVFVLQLSVAALANAVLHKIVNLWGDQLAQRQALLRPPR
jgi:hypothetical protein